MARSLGMRAHPQRLGVDAVAGRARPTPGQAGLGTGLISPRWVRVIGAAPDVAARTGRASTHIALAYPAMSPSDPEYARHVRGTRHPDGTPAWHFELVTRHEGTLDSRQLTTRLSQMVEKCVMRAKIIVAVAALAGGVIAVWPSPAGATSCTSYSSGRVTCRSYDSSTYGSGGYSYSSSNPRTGYSSTGYRNTYPSGGSSGYRSYSSGSGWGTSSYSNPYSGRGYASYGSSGYSYSNNGRSLYGSSNYGSPSVGFR
jgi:hypothetical protein